MYLKIHCDCMWMWFAWWMWISYVESVPQKRYGLLKMLKLNDSIRWDKRIFALCTHSDRFITQCTNTKVRSTEEMQKEIMIGFVNNLCIFSSSWLLGLIVTKTMKTLNSKTIFFVIMSNSFIGTYEFLTDIILLRI